MDGWGEGRASAKLPPRWPTPSSPSAGRGPKRDRTCPWPLIESQLEASWAGGGGKDTGRWELSSRGAGPGQPSNPGPPLPASPSPTSMAETLRAGAGRSCRSMSSSLSLPSKAVEIVTGSQGQAWTKPSLLAPSLFFLRFLLLPNVRMPTRHPDILPEGSGLPHGPDPGTAGSVDRAEPGLSGPHQRATLGGAMPDRASVSEWGREGEKPKL